MSMNYQIVYDATWLLRCQGLPHCADLLVSDHPGRESDLAFDTVPSEGESAQGPVIGCEATSAPAADLNENPAFIVDCERGDLNPHALRHWILSSK
jgi:hypothetical protein